MEAWFGTFNGSTKKILTYSKSFSEDEILKIRNQFMTVRQSPGLHSSHTWRPIETQDQTYYVCLANFDFTHVAYVDSYWTPVIMLTVKFATAGSPADPIRTVFDDRGTHQMHLRDYFDHPVKIEYPPNYPAIPPRIRVERPRYTNMNGSHEHHTLYNGWICYFRGNEGWNLQKSTTITALNEAIGWMIRHYKVFGW